MSDGRSGDGPTHDGPGNDEQSSDGPTSDGPTSDGPTSDGPTSDGPTSDGPTSDGPTSDGPVNDGPANDGQRFDQLPATAEEREVAGRATREEVVEWWEGRFGADPETFDGYSFWEKGAGKIWIYNGEAPNGIRIEAIGMTFLRTRQEHWKPTTRAVSRFGRHATRNVIELDDTEARAFAAGEDQDIERWDGDWGYLIAAHAIAGDLEPIGVGLYLHGELRSRIPKGSREELGTLVE